MEIDAINQLENLRSFLTRIVERANTKGAIYDDEWPEYTSHMALIKGLISAAKCNDLDIGTPE